MHMFLDMILKKLRHVERFENLYLTFVACAMYASTSVRRQDRRSHSGFDARLPVSVHRPDRDWA